MCIRDYGMLKIQRHGVFSLTFDYERFKYRMLECKRNYARPGALYVDHLLNKNDIDIPGISEHWLFPHSLNFLGSINVKYDYAAVCDNDLCTPPSCSGCYARGKGGVALWHKRLSHCISNIDTGDDRIIGIDLSLKNGTHLVIFCVYLPSSNYNNDFYFEYLNTLCDIYDQHSSYAQVVFLGDFNTQIRGPKRTINVTSRVRAAHRFLEQTDMFSLNMCSFCEGPPYSFAPYETNENRTMIDHIIVQSGMTDLFTNCSIIDEH